MGVATGMQPAAAKNLGRVVATKQLPKAAGVVVLLAALGAAGFGLSDLLSHSGGSIVSALAMLAIAAALTVAALYSFSLKFEICENGATAQSLFGKNAVSFDEVRTFKFARVRVGAEPQVSMTLIPMNGKPLRIVAKPSVRNPLDQELESLNEKLSTRIAAKMQTQLTRAGRVEWMGAVAGSIPAQPKILISKDGWVIADKKGDRNVLFSEVAPDFSNGFFFLRSRQDKKVIFQAKADTPNFYPGWKLVTELAPPAN